METAIQAQTIPILLYLGHFCLWLQQRFCSGGNFKTVSKVLSPIFYNFITSTIFAVDA